jgi:hypothetical protein
MKTREYDINAYVVDGVLRLTAYQYEYSDKPNGLGEPISTNTSADYLTLSLNMDSPNNAEAVAYLLDDENWSVVNLVGEPTEQEVWQAIVDKWQDYDSPWENMTWLDYAPEQIRAWADMLPEYTPNLVHEWQDIALLPTLHRGETRQVKCLNCEATYEQSRLTMDEQYEMLG